MPAGQAAAAAEYLRRGMGEERKGSGGREIRRMGPRWGSWERARRFLSRPAAGCQAPGGRWGSSGDPRQGLAGQPGILTACAGREASSAGAGGAHWRSLAEMGRGATGDLRCLGAVARPEDVSGRRGGPHMKATHTARDVRKTTSWLLRIAHPREVCPVNANAWL